MPGIGILSDFRELSFCASCGPYFICNETKLQIIIVGVQEGNKEEYYLLICACQKTHLIDHRSLP